MSVACALTTLDNPFDPFEQFDDWFMFDLAKGYNCCGRMMRMAHISDDMSQSEIDVEIERAIDKIISQDFMNVYKKVTKQLIVSN